MGEITIATVFDHDGTLAVDLPEDFRTTGGKVRIIQNGDAVRIEPVAVEKAIAKSPVDETLENFRATVKRVREEEAANPKPFQTIGRKLTREEREDMFAKIHSLTGGEFMPEGREQPPMPDDDYDLSFD